MYLIQYLEIIFLMHFCIFQMKMSPSSSSSFFYCIMC